MSSSLLVYTVCVFRTSPSVYLLRVYFTYPAYLYYHCRIIITGGDRWIGHSHQEYTVRLWWEFRWHYVIVVLGYVRWGSVRHSATLYMFTRRIFDNNNLSEEVCALLSVSLIYLCSHKEKATGNWSRKPIYLHAFHSKLPVFAILTLNDYTNEILNIVIKITVLFSFALSHVIIG